MKNLTVNLLSRSEKVLGFSRMRRGAVAVPHPPLTCPYPDNSGTPATLTCLPGGRGSRASRKGSLPCLGSKTPALNPPVPFPRPPPEVPPLTKVTKLQGHKLVDLQEGRPESLLWASVETLPLPPHPHPPTLVMMRMAT